MDRSSEVSIDGEIGIDDMSACREALVVVQPRTVISWQRKRFRDHWTRVSRQIEAV